jgi:ABC-2 type transport system ATP-binding protein
LQRVGIINHGKLLALGTPGELKSRIDQRVRLELLFKPEFADYDALLTSLGETHILTQQHRVLLCQRNSVRQAIDVVLDAIGLDRLDDFRILTPSLEDVYLQLGGGTKLD